MTPARPTLFSTVIGSSRAIRDTLRAAQRAAETDANIYIYGEHGTGKELIARAIHYSGPRAQRPLITLDSTAIPEGLMESHMFGHVRGAFTGAVQNQPGVLSTANTGSLFIDEIGELSLPLQAKLLRAIQFREFTMVGGNQRQRTDIRLITATNRDLRRAVAEGQFRADLYYRIAVVQIVVPPLRQRREDIPLLAQYFIEKFSAAYRRPIRRPTAAALDALVSFDWPGNVRQLENCLEQAIIFAQGDILDIEDLRFASDRRADVRDAAAPTTIGSFTGRSLRDLETWYIQQTLQRLGGNRTKTAEYLGLSLRGLQYKLKRYAAAETTWVGNLA